MLSVVDIIGDDLQGEVRSLVDLLGLHAYEWFSARLEVTELEGYVLLDSIEIAIDGCKHPTWRGNQFHFYVAIIIGAQKITKVVVEFH